LYKKKNWPELVHLFINTAAGFTIVTAVKYLTNVPRPELSPILLRMDPSFPSRHSFISGLSMHFSNKIFKGLLKAAALIYLVLIPLGSVYIGVHYPSDAVAGLLIGLLLPRIITQKRSVRIWNGVRRIVALLNNRIKL
jgi:membrane-associated phospholipid phosphatase